MKLYIYICALLAIMHSAVSVAQTELKDPIGLKGMMLGSDISDVEKSNQGFSLKCELRALLILHVRGVKDD